MRTITLMVFVFLSGACLGLLVGSTDRSQHRPEFNGRSHVFVIQRVDQLPDHGPVLADWGKTTFFVESGEEFDSTTSEVYGLLGMRKRSN